LNSSHSDMSVTFKEWTVLVS